MGGVGAGFLGSLLGRLFGFAVSAVGAVGLTLQCFLVLPVIQAITEPPRTDLIVSEMDTSVLPPPPPAPEEEEPEEEPEPEEAPPELAEDTAPLDLSQLELALNPGFGDGWGAADMQVDLSNLVAGDEAAESLFTLADLDQRPRCVYQPSPVVDAKLQRKAPATVYVLFAVDTRGRVKDPVVQRSSDPAFERSALRAVKQWRFEPGRLDGEPVSVVELEARLRAAAPPSVVLRMERSPLSDVAAAAHAAGVHEIRLAYDATGGTP